jgi:putative long chain acyl-CoA synthase
MSLLPKTITAPAGRIGAAAQNALEVARFGGLTTDDQPSPYEVTDEQRVYRLRRYYPNGASAQAPQILLVPPLMLAAEIYDVSPTSSAVSILHEHADLAWAGRRGAPAAGVRRCVLPLPGPRLRRPGRG